MPEYQGPDPFGRQIEQSLVGWDAAQRTLGLEALGPLAIKYVSAWLASQYAPNPSALKISESLNMTWGIGTYVAPLSAPVSSGMYGRVGVVAAFEPSSWRFFDATQPEARVLYLQWAQSQAGWYDDVLMTVHALSGNAYLRNTFRERYEIDCVLFHPDQAGNSFTRPTDVWMCVADFDGRGTLRTDFSRKLAAARLTVLLDEEFSDAGSFMAPERSVSPLVEPVTRQIALRMAVAYPVPDRLLADRIAQQFRSNGFVHYHIAP